MRFKIKKRIKNTNMPDLGDFKEVNKFAIIPRRIDDEIVWLERVIHVYEYAEDMSFVYDTAVPIHRWIYRKSILPYQK